MSDEAEKVADEPVVTAKFEAKVEDDGKYKSIAREQEKKYITAAREAEELKKKLAEYETRDLSELEKAQKEAADAKAALETENAARRKAELMALRTRIGAEKGLPAAFIDRLTGDDEESIIADAEKLLAAIPKQETALDIGQGKKGEPTDPDVTAFAAGLGVH